MTDHVHGNVLSRTWQPVEPAGSSVSGATRNAAAAAVGSSSCTTTGEACTTYYSYYYNDANPLDPRNDELTGVRDARSASATDNTYLTSYVYNTAGELTSSTKPATSDFPSGRTTGYVSSTTSTAAYGGGTTSAGLLLSQTTPGRAVCRGELLVRDAQCVEVTEGRRPWAARSVQDESPGRHIPGERLAERQIDIIRPGCPVKVGIPGDGGGYGVGVVEANDRRRSPGGTRADHRPGVHAQDAAARPAELQGDCAAYNAGPHHDGVVVPGAPGGAHRRLTGGWPWSAGIPRFHRVRVPGRSLTACSRRTVRAR
jgi:hypothetical protein